MRHFSPHVPCHYEPTAEHMFHTVKRMSEGAPGLDAWTVREAKLLPKKAWQALINLMRRWFLNPLGPPPALPVLRKKRTPVEKNGSVDKIPLPSDIRPIDIHSVLVRAYSSALTAQLKPWLREIVHPTQVVTMSGLFTELGRLSIWTECALNKAHVICALSLDLTKMYNMVSATIAKRLAVVAGMSEITAKLLVGPVGMDGRYLEAPNELNLIALRRMTEEFPKDFQHPSYSQSW